MQRSQGCYGELEELTVDDIWQTADAGDQELRRLAHSSRRGTVELGAEDKLLARHDQSAVTRTSTDVLRY